MLREFDLQRMHWADKTQSMLHQRQMEACETRLLSYPTESIFTLQDERETEWWWQCSYDAEESLKSPVLHTLREMRANVLARLPVEAALLTETEHALIVRLILCGGRRASTAGRSCPPLNHCCAAFGARWRWTSRTFCCTCRGN